MKILAQWETLDEAGLIRAAVFNAETGLRIANVCKTPVGWKVFPLYASARPSRKGREYPSEAIKSYFGKNVQIQAEGTHKFTANGSRLYDAGQGRTVTIPE